MLAIIALVAGILSVMTCWLPVLGLLLAVTALICGTKAVKGHTGKGLSIAGIVLGALAVLPAIVMTLTGVIVLLGMLA